MMRSFDEFMTIVQRLRRECPWDREQTHESLRYSFIEETYEVIDAIDHQSSDGLQEELGDVLLHLGLQAIIAEEQGEFSMEEVLQTITEKLIRRHPHIFQETKIHTREQQLETWERIKKREGRTSLLSGVPKSLPALFRAYRIQEKASKIGFDWRERTEVWKKVEEEIQELHAALRSNERDKAVEEFGDLLFSLVNYARFIHVNPEEALQNTTNKFTHRFQQIEQRARTQGKNVDSLSFKEMDRLWEDVKKDEQRNQPKPGQ